MSVRLRVCSSRALSRLRALFRIGAWCSDPGTHVLSFGFVSGFGHLRSVFCLVVWVCSLDFARRHALLSTCVLWLHAVRVLSAACIHVMSCAVWHAACGFHCLCAFMLSCLVWTCSLWVFSLAACRVLFCIWLMILFNLVSISNVIIKNIKYRPSLKTIYVLFHSGYIYGPNKTHCNWYEGTNIKIHLYHFYDNCL